MQVENMRTANGGYAANQFLIRTGGGVIFLSYRSQIATKAYDGTTTLYAPYWDMYSTTTNRYLLQFLNEDSIRDIRVKVKLGIYLTE